MLPLLVARYAGELCVEVLAPTGRRSTSEGARGSSVERRGEGGARQRCFLLCYRPLGYSQVLAAAWAAPADGDPGSGRGLDGGPLEWLRAVAAGRTPAFGT